MIKFKFINKIESFDLRNHKSNDKDIFIFIIALLYSEDISKTIHSIKTIYNYY